MRSSYNENEVTILLKDISGLVVPLSNIEREKRIQAGIHYSEMLPEEKLPSDEYKKTFLDALERYAAPTAKAVEILSEKIYSDKGKETVIVSLARAGTPIGILIKRYFNYKYDLEIPHYTISIIRGKGIDKNAVKYILERHSPESIQFVDGWTGKGAIQRQLEEALTDAVNIDNKVAVLSDPAFVAGKCGTHNDFLIPSSCLNSTVSGLISRTFYRNDIIGEDDFHGAMYYNDFESEDMTALFLDRVEKEFGTSYRFDEDTRMKESPHNEILKIAEKYKISDINYIKPGLGEATRVLLRRIPWKILVNSFDDYENLGHIYQLAKEKGVALELYPLDHYRACGLIKNLSDT